MKRGIGLLSALFVFLLLFSACAASPSSTSAAPPPASPSANAMAPVPVSEFLQNNVPAPTRLYTLMIEGQNKTVALNQDGKVVLEEQSVRILRDVITDEPYLLAAERFETEILYHQLLADGFPFPSETALFDLNGNLLVDWQRGFAYEAAFGQYVLRQNQALHGYTLDYPPGASADCIHYVTGEVVLDSITHFSGLGNQQEAAVYDKYSNLGLVNRRMEKGKGWPWREDYSVTSAWNNYYIATSGTEMYKPNCQLLDKELNPVLPGYYANISVASPNADYLILSADYWPEKNGEPQRQSAAAFTADGRLEYLPPVFTYISFFDGEIVQGYCDSSTFPESNYGTPYVLMHKNGSMLIDEVFITAVPIVTDANGRYDFAVVQTGSRFTTYNRSGKVIATQDKPNYRLGYEIAPGYFDCSSSAEGKEVFLDKHLQPAANVTSYVTHGAGCREGYFINVLDPPPNQNRHNLIDIHGNILIENMERVYECHPDCLLVKWNGYVGMVDYAGNWLYQTPA